LARRPKSFLKHDLIAAIFFITVLYLKAPSQNIIQKYGT